MDGLRVYVSGFLLLLCDGSFGSSFSMFYVCFCRIASCAGTFIFLFGGISFRVFVSKLLSSVYGFLPFVVGRVVQ